MKSKVISSTVDGLSLLVSKWSGNREHGFERLAALAVLLVILVGISPMSVEASVTVVDGIEVVVEMDQEQYEAEDSITVTIHVTNQREETVVIASLEQFIPEGYMLAEESQDALEDFELSAGESRTLTTVLEPLPQPEQEEEATDVLDLLLEGETWGIPNLLLLLAMILLIVIFSILT